MSTATPGSTSTGAGAKRQRSERHGWRADMPLRKYTPTPTSGTAPLHRRLNYGYADFSPATHQMNENQLTERTIRYGFVDMPVVKEHKSCHEIVYDRLRDTRVFQELQSFAAGVAQRQWARGRVLSQNLPRLPNRSVRSDEQREEWLHSLSNPHIPLSTLVAGVPFGLRGERLLESLYLHKVPVTRSIWAIRLIGLYEMMASQTRVCDHALLKQLEAQYTPTWSRQFTSYVEHTLQNAPTAEKSASSDEWMRQWQFCLQMMHAQYDQGLLDQRMLVSWLVTQLRQASVDKCMVLLPVAQDYTSEIARSRNPLRKLIAAVVFRIEQSARYPSLHRLHEQLGAYLIELFLSMPDAFVEPSTWHAHCNALHTASSFIDGKRRQPLLALISQVNARNFRFACLADDSNGQLNEQPADKHERVFHELDAIGPDTDIAGVLKRVFGESMEQINGHSVRLVCYWATNYRMPNKQFRQLVAARLCRLHLDGYDSVAKLQLQSAIVGFLDIYPLPDDKDQRECAVRSVCSLLEHLAYVQCFSFSKYLQLLTARGDFFGSRLKQPRAQRHLSLVSGLPANSIEICRQQQLLLYDCDYKVANSTDVTSQLQKALCAALPFMVAYTCAAPFRAKLSKSDQGGIDPEIVCWWMPCLKDPFDATLLPAPTYFTSCSLQSSLAQEPCTKEWIAPLVDHFVDERMLATNMLDQLRQLLKSAQRSDVDLVVNHRLLPMVYDYVVKDVTVGVDNWRVITQPGTSLLNRRQAAVVISVLIEAGYFSQLLDFLLWLLAHTRANHIISLSHGTLRRFTQTWILLGRLSRAVAAIEQSFTGSSESFDFESLRTLQHWHSAEPQTTQQAFQRVSAEYESFVSSHASMLVAQGSGHVPSQLSTGKELLQLAQQLVRDRARDAISSAADEIDWAILPCFQKLTRVAFSATNHQRIDMGASGLHTDLSGLPASTLRPRLQSMLAFIATEAIRAAVHTGRTLKLRTGERALDEVSLRTFIDICVLFIRWFALNSGLLADPEEFASPLLAALESALREWILSSETAVAGSLDATSTPSNGQQSLELEVAMFIGHTLVTSLLAAGCLRIHELVPWLINHCKQPVSQQTAAQYACIAGIIRALGEPVACNLEPEDPRQLYETIEMSAHWISAFSLYKLSRIQSIELVFTSAMASGKLRDAGLSLIAQPLVRFVSALAQSQCIQGIVRYVPSTESTGYYTVLEIYRANIEPQISDAQVTLPVKRALLRALMTLCEREDPFENGFSAMTTAEVAHRLHRTLRQFCFGSGLTSVYELSTILNSLLLFANSALRESEASTDAFAMAAGGARMIQSTANASSGHSRATSQDPDGIMEQQVQFVTNASAYLVSCVQNALFTWDISDQKRACLAKALSTLAPDVVLQIVEACSQTLFALHMEKACNLDDTAPTESAVDGKDDEADSSTVMSVDSRVIHLVKLGANLAQASDMADAFIENFMSLTKDPGDDEEFAAENVQAAFKRGLALAQFIGKLVAALGQLSEVKKQQEFKDSRLVQSLRAFACAILGQLESLAKNASCRVAFASSLCIAKDQKPCPTDAASGLDTKQLQSMVLWRLLAVRPLCHLIRLFPDEFGAGEWLMTLITLCSAPSCQASASMPEGVRLFELLSDFAAIISESITGSMRKQSLVLLRLVAPEVRNLVSDRKHAATLSRLFPFEMSTTRTSDLVCREIEGIDNPWLWIEALEFAPLLSLNLSALSNGNGGGLEGMTPFTLRGRVEQEAKANKGGEVAVGYLANLRRGEPNASHEQRVAESRRLQYLENPYFPMQPAMVFPLAETPVPWRLFAAKRRRMDAETRLVWRSQCEAAFNS
ncbi:hypothetical protein EV183_003322 [Coemansia sp. RSA 2336]|nr:hypothetical protein EV183_003322 [Coemansia sp. RSA 2336]